MARCDNKPADSPVALERYASALRSYFQRRVAQDADVDDLIQEVFVRLLNRQPQESIENLSGYVFQTAANLLRERGRRFGRHDGIGAAFLSGGLLEGNEDFSPERIHSARQICAQLEVYLRELPERVRNVFVLNRFEELTGVQIAQRLGVSVSTVEKDMMRAILHLKDRLK